MLLVGALLAGIVPPVPAAAAGCQFVLGFKTLRALIPDQVGSCRDNEHHNPLNGDGLQATTGRNGAGGLLVWRKADNWTAFTDGYRTWVNGPFGVEERLNTERFSWEAPSPRSGPCCVGAWVADPHPPVGATETVFGQIYDWNGRVVPGARLHAVWHFPGGDRTCDGGPSTADAPASCAVSVAGSSGTLVRIDLTLSTAGQSYRASTEFTSH